MTCCHLCSLRQGLRKRVETRLCIVFLCMRPTYQPRFMLFILKPRADFVSGGKGTGGGGGGGKRKGRSREGEGE